MVTAGRAPFFPPEGQLKRHRHKVRTAQLRRHLIDHGISRCPQTGKEISEAGISILEIVQLLLHVALRIPAHKAVQLLLLHSGKATLRQYVPGHVFQQEMQKCADLRRVKGGGLPWSCPEAVLHEVSKMARAHPLQPGGRHGDPISIQRPDRPPGQPPPPQGRRPLHGRQTPGKGGRPGEIRHSGPPGALARPSRSRQQGC